MHGHLLRVLARRDGERHGQPERREMVLRADRVDVGEHPVLERVERRAVADVLCRRRGCNAAEGEGQAGNGSRRGGTA